MTLLQFYFIRHGETFSNSGQKMSGGGDDGFLTEKGKIQSLQAGKEFQKLNPLPSVIYHSDLRRAKDTAIFINESLKIPIEEKSEFAEQHLGDWEKQSWSVISGHFMRREDPPNGESYPNFYQRLKRGLQSVEWQVNNLPIIVSHGGVLLGIRALCGIHSNDWPDNCSILKMSISGNWESPSLSEEKLT